MSQQKPNKQKSSKQANIIFVLILLYILVGSAFFTFYSIDKHNKRIKSIPLIKNEAPKTEETTFLNMALPSESKTIDIYQTYYTNPLIITFEKGRVLVDGLKDNKVELKISELLKELDASQNSKGETSCVTTFNVSNVLSVTCKQQSKNINLLTGEELTLADIFNKESNLHSILLDGIYKFACLKSNCATDNLSNLKSNVENEIAMALKNLPDNYTNFKITAQSIEFNDILINDEPLKINFADYYEDITIFDRFLSIDNIYERNNDNVYAWSEFNNNEDIYTKSYFLAKNNYLTLNIENKTGDDVANFESNIKQDLDMNTIGKKIEDELLYKYNLNEESTNLRYIAINASIHYNRASANQIKYNIEISEYDKDTLPLRILGDNIVKPKTTNTLNKSDMLLDGNNNASYLATNPTSIFPEFTTKLYNYITNDIQNNDESIFKAYEENLDKDFQDLINEASYTIDPTNRRIFMDYHQKDETNHQINISLFLPYTLFE